MHRKFFGDIAAVLFPIFFLIAITPLGSQEFAGETPEVGAKKGRHCATCGTVPYPSNTGYITSAPIVNSPQVWKFASEPHLRPLKIKVNKYEDGTSSGLIFTAPYGFSSQPTVGQNGSLIFDSKGTPIWFKPLGVNLMNTDFRVQQLYGKPVLTFWQGTLATPPAYTNTPGGSSEPGSCYYILDDTYSVITTVSAQNGFTSDIHEFLITPQNTALLLSTKAVPMDLTRYGGPKDGYVQNFAIQEIDLQTNELLFFWEALDHIPLQDSYVDASNAISSGNVWDVYHLNSLGLTDHVDDIIISSRSMWAIYRINKPTGDIIWQLGGKQSDFRIARGAEFSWQHDARFLPNNIISLFNDNSDGSSSPNDVPSHGLALKLDLDNMTARQYKSYFHDPNITVASQGNLQSLPNGNKFVGWGQSQYFSEYKNKGNNVFEPELSLLYDAQMPASNAYTYRAYRHDWVGKPHYPPSIAVKARKGETVVFASWNGSTETARWEVFAGHAPHELSKIECKAKSGFETHIRVGHDGPFFQVKALDHKGRIIGESKVEKFLGVNRPCG